MTLVFQRQEAKKLSFQEEKYAENIQASLLKFAELNLKIPDQGDVLSCCSTGITSNRAYLLIDVLAMADFVKADEGDERAEFEKIGTARGFAHDFDVHATEIFTRRSISYETRYEKVPMDKPELWDWDSDPFERENFFGDREEYLRTYPDKILIFVSINYDVASKLNNILITQAEEIVRKDLKIFSDGHTETLKRKFGAEEGSTLFQNVFINLASGIHRNPILTSSYPTIRAEGAKKANKETRNALKKEFIKAEKLFHKVLGHETGREAFKNVLRSYTNSSVYSLSRK
jgi:hypothetical protein